MASISVPGAIIGSSVLGAGVSALGASSAADAQKSAANQASQTELAMYNQTQALENPYVQSGYGAMNTLNYLLGLPTQATGAGAAGVGSGTGSLTTDQANALLQSRPDVMEAYQKARAAADPNSATAWAKVSSPQAYANYWYNNMGGSGSYQIPGASTAGGSPSSTSALSAAGLGAGSLLKPFSLSDLPNDPGYQFQLQQGLSAIQNQSSVGGLGGNTLKALNDYAQGQASTEYQTAYNNYTNRQNQLYSMLSGISGSGQNAAAGLASAGSSVANSVAQNQIGAGNASAAGTVGATNAVSSGLNSGVSNYMLYNLMNQNPAGVYSV